MRLGQEKPSFELVGINRADVDLRDLDKVKSHFQEIRPDAILHCAAKVGGIQANIDNPVDFLSDNILMDEAVLLAAKSLQIDKLIYFGSSCMYPKDYRQPLVEDDVLGGPLEPTNQGYALAKIVGAELAASIAKETGYAYRTLIMSNLYGPGDNFTVKSSHLIASTLIKAHAAKISGDAFIDVWGDGEARREFTYVDDVADWILKNLVNILDWPIRMNIGAGNDHSINEYYELALKSVGYKAELRHDLSKPVGMKQKLMDSSLAMRHANWNPATPIQDGYKLAYNYYLRKAF